MNGNSRSQCSNKDDENIKHVTNKSKYSKHNTVKKCSECTKGVPEPGTLKCHKIGQEDGEIIREEGDLCKGITEKGHECTYKASRIHDYEYCLKHGKQAFINECKKNGKKACMSRYACNGGHNGGRAVLDLHYPFSLCQSCLQRCRDSDHERRNEVGKLNQMERNQNTNFRICYDCPITHSGYIFHNLTNMGIDSRGNISNKCKFHFEIQQIIEEGRDRNYNERIEQQRIYEADPDVIERHRKWAEDNPDKTYISCILSRNRKREENEEEFLHKNAEYMIFYRLTHYEIYEYKEFLRKTVPCKAYKTYRERCIRDHIPDDLSYERYEFLVQDKCFYCTFKDDERLNGIDRKNNLEGYTYKNSVPCCSMCNYMKNTLNEETFILMCAHIATYRMMGNYGLFPYVFADYNGGSYEKYYERAQKKGFDLTKMITENQFNEIISNRCYICRKKNTKDHQNGIDRIDNDIGYVFDNCKSCCGNCNFLKNNYDFGDVMIKCGNIAQRHKNFISELEKNWKGSSFRDKNIFKIKLSDKQKLEKKNQRENERREKRKSNNTLEAINERAKEIKNNKSKIKSSDLISSDKQIITNIPEKEDDHLNRELMENNADYFTHSEIVSPTKNIKQKLSNKNNKKFLMTELGPLEFDPNMLPITTKCRGKTEEKFQKEIECEIREWNKNIENLRSRLSPEIKPIETVIQNDQDKNWDEIQEHMNNYVFKLKELYFPQEEISIGVDIKNPEDMKPFNKTVNKKVSSPKRKKKTSARSKNNNRMSGSKTNGSLKIPAKKENNSKKYSLGGSKTTNPVKSRTIK